jgi:hypothetical protein
MEVIADRQWSISLADHQSQPVVILDETLRQRAGDPPKRLRTTE